MRTFEDSLKRVLDPDHYLWCMIGHDADNAALERVVELRLDIPACNVPKAVEAMAALGWNFASRPDEATDPLERVYFRKRTAVQADDVRLLLTGALKVADDFNGTLMSWINVEDLED